MSRRYLIEEGFQAVVPVDNLLWNLYPFTGRENGNGGLCGIWSYPALDAVAELVERELAVKKMAVCGRNSGSVWTDLEFGNSIASVEYLGLVFQACDRCSFS